MNPVELLIFAATCDFFARTHRKESVRENFAHEVEQIKIYNAARNVYKNLEKLHFVK